eukprot:GGOE01057162.1.p2 GENE.GGOE01057162.1~~GGOE01057162.1.p2  ORF type:complete len:282 (+),score=95.51 GGOE01057162.1:88-933(+)
MGDSEKLRKELLMRAKQLKSRFEALAIRLEETAAPAASLTPPATTAAWAPPVQPLAQPVEPAPDFRLADFPEAVRKLKQILTVLRRHRDAGAFNQPVDAQALQIPDYHTIIQHPMDLGTVAKKLDNYHQHYTTAQELAEDVRLIWQNCKLYNGQQHALSQSAAELERSFETKFKQVLDRYSGNAVDPDVGNAAKRPKNDADRKPEGPMTYEEKQQLGQMIGMLDNQYSTQVFDLIHSSCPMALDDTSDEVELDIEKLDVQTARKLERFVKSVLNRPQGRSA